ncbi:hypothetical protein K469DRAFT_600904, partial [Zopfia rhizophila CBS 207.26]
INLLGPMELKQKVGDILGKARIYLQPPKRLQEGMKLENPHIIEFPNLKMDLDLMLSNDPSQQSSRQSHSDHCVFSQVLDHLDQEEHLEAVQLDPRMITTLQDYQSLGVNFILQRESAVSPLSSFSLWDLTGRTSHTPQDTYGGILADEMGLGKSLMILTAIAITQNQSRRYMENLDGSSVNLKRVTRATLVVVPSASEHFIPDTFRVHKYHGNNKETELDKLADFDIIITTYATLAAQTIGKSHLHQLTWFRVVLDEAHVIRNHNTKYFRAVTSLSARNRWCLSGTPIQNSLEDLGSLVRFLQVISLHSSTDFKRYCIIPAEKSSVKGFQNIRALLKCICLRRTQELLQLPESQTTQYFIDMSSIERLQYDGIKSRYRKALDDAVCGRSPTEGYRYVLQALLKLRMVCNHGLSTSDTELLTTNDEAEILAILQEGSASCAYCGGEVSTDGQKSDYAAAKMPACSHIVCGAKCPLCSILLEPDRLRSPSHDTIAAVESSPHVKFVSSKFSKLLEDINEHKTREKRYVIIFSCWKKTLDELANILSKRGLPFVQLDGSLSLGARREVLKNFSQCSETTLLMTLGTGAVGLNLTAASRIHIIEPQWNPTVESQSIGRAVRLGQKKRVSVIRYIMKDTVEEVRGDCLRSLKKVQCFNTSIAVYPVTTEQKTAASKLRLW